MSNSPKSMAPSPTPPARYACGVATRPPRSGPSARRRHPRLQRPKQPGTAMTYDTTLLETLSPAKVPAPLPECLKRDRLNAGYFAQFTAAQLALVIALSTIFLWTSLHKLHHTDLWGHLDFGRWIAQHRSLPAIDPFAATPSNIPFVPSAWLAQLLG